MAKAEKDNQTGTIGSNRTTIRSRNTRESLAIKLSSIRHMMLDGANNSEIMAALDIPQRTFYRYMDKIYKEDRIELANKNKETLATHILLLRERLMQSIKNCQNIALDSTVSAKERIEAERLKIDASVAIARLEREGTTISQVNSYIYEEHTDHNNFELARNYRDNDNILNNDEM
jgi:hypothetical protein